MRFACKFKSRDQGAYDQKNEFICLMFWVIYIKTMSLFWLQMCCSYIWIHLTFGCMYIWHCKSITLQKGLSKSQWKALALKHNLRNDQSSRGIHIFPRYDQSRRWSLQEVLLICLDPLVNFIILCNSHKQLRGEARYLNILILPLSVSQTKRF